MRICTDIAQLQQLISEAALESRPFLFAVNFEKTEGLFSDHPLEDEELCFSIRGKGSHQKKLMQNTYAIPSEALQFHPESIETYGKKFQTVHHGLRHGDSFLLNLTTRTPIDCNLSLEEIYHQSPAPYKICWPGRFVCFSPEPFLHISQEGKISSYPMKGTIDATLPQAKERLMADEKEKAEHYTICDLIRNDLNLIAQKVRIERFRYCETIRTSTGSILQTSSEICGDLGPNWKENLGEKILQLLPAGSISGAPKKASIGLIHQAETNDRGYYTGVFGYFDGQSLESAVMIRFISEEDGQKYYYSGGGITINSHLEDEYQEVIEKVYLPQPTAFIETLKIEDGHICEVEAHLRRMEQTLQETNLNTAINTFTELFRILRTNDLPALKAYAGRLNAAQAPLPDPGKTYRLSIDYSYRPLNIRILEYKFKPIESFKCLPAEQLDYHLKYADRKPLEELYARRGDCDEIILIQDGHVTDCSIGNLALLRDGRYYTPRTFLLNGLMRQQLICEGRLTETDIREEDLPDFEKIVVINSMRSL